MLPDQVRPPVRILFVGINPGVRSEAIGHHFAGYSNRFWKLLYGAGLVPEPLGPEDDGRLPEWGLGVTNLIPRCTPGIDGLTTLHVTHSRTEARKLADRLFVLAEGRLQQRPMTDLSRINDVPDAVTFRAGIY